MSEKLLNSYGYKVLAYNQYMLYIFNHNDKIISEALKQRISKFINHPVKWVIYNPNDDDEGFLLMGNNKKELIQEAVSRLELIL